MNLKISLRPMMDGRHEGVIEAQLAERANKQAELDGYAQVGRNEVLLSGRTTGSGQMELSESLIGRLLALLSVEA